MTKRVLIVVFMVFALFLSACGNNNEATETPNAENSNETVGETTNEGDNEQQQPVEQEPAKPTDYGPATIVITSSSGWTDEAFWEQFGAIREKFPQHTFNYIRKATGTTYPELLAAGHPIDIYWESIGGLAAPIELGLGSDLTELIKKHNVDLNMIDASMLETAKSFSESAVLHALPVLNNTLALYFNKDLFDNFGVEYPKSGITWEEVIELNKTLTRTTDGIDYVGVSIMLPHYFNLNPISVRYTDAADQATINSNNSFIPMFQTLRDLAQAPGYTEVTRSLSTKSYSQSIPFRNHFTIDKTAAMFAGLANTHLTQAQYMDEMNWDVLPFPTYKEAPDMNPKAYPTYFGVSETSKFKDQSMEVIKYLVSEEFQSIVSRSGAQPVIHSDAVKNVFAADTNFADKNVKSLLYPSFAPGEYTIYDGIVQGIYYKNLNPYLLGDMDLNTLRRVAEEEANLAISEAKSK